MKRETLKSLATIFLLGTSTTVASAQAPATMPPIKATSGESGIAVPTTSVVVPLGSLAKSGESATTTSETASRIAGLVMTLVDRDSWKDHGGKGTIFYIAETRSLVVTNNTKAVQKVGELVKSIQEKLSVTFKVRASLVSADEGKFAVYSPDSKQTPITLEQNQPIVFDRDQAELIFKSLQNSPNQVVTAPTFLTKDGVQGRVVVGEYRPTSPANVSTEWNIHHADKTLVGVLWDLLPQLTHRDGYVLLDTKMHYSEGPDRKITYAAKLEMPIGGVVIVKVGRRPVENNTDAEPSSFDPGWVRFFQQTWKKKVAQDMFIVLNVETTNSASIQATPFLSMVETSIRPIAATLPRTVSVRPTVTSVAVPALGSVPVVLDFARVAAPPSLVKTAAWFDTIENPSLKNVMANYLQCARDGDFKLAGKYAAKALAIDPQCFDDQK